ncbi:MAG: hypothetical protein ACYSW3_26480 [Planctomycetota bacterium]|jgi:hypothetical protein
MEFFNKKEEVLDLQLTQYGKYLLSIGKLNPAYYTLHDDNVIYDSEFSQGAELQNEARVRIQSDTPTLKTQHNFVSIDAMQSKASDFQDAKERAEVVSRPLATSNLGSDKLPSWNINTLGGNLVEGSTTPTTAASGSSIVQEIPQIGAEVTYYITPVMMGNEFTEGEIEEVNQGFADGIPQDILEGIDIAFETEVLQDGSSFLIDKDDLILQIVEDNAPMGSDNFEVEVFEVASDGELIPMVFKKEPILIVNDILVEAVEEDDVEIDSTFVEYYFDLELDGEISSDVICPKLVNADKDIYKYAFKEFACPDIQPNYQYLSPYSQKETDTECGD